MGKLTNKINRKLNTLRSEYRADCIFSKKLARYRLWDTVFSSIRLRSLASFYRKKREEWLLAYLCDLLKEVNDKHKDDKCTGEASESLPIWICWWTGEETAPDLVKQCIKSIRNNAGNHPVYMITESNYLDYINVHDYMLDKAKSGTMKLAHLSDYIRISLLEKYGGLWLDATIFCSDTIDDSMFKMPFFTCKSEWQECGYISRMQWVTFILGGYKGNVVFRYLKDVFEKYWSTHDTAIDYLMFDYFIEIGRQKIPFFKQCLENVPINNIHRDDLQAAFNAKLSAEDFATVIKEDTALYKLSWREKYSEVTSDGKKSIYGYFLEMKI